MLTLTRHQPSSEFRPGRTAEASGYRAWVARAPKQPLVFETIDPGHFPMSRINEAFARLESGKVSYRIVVDADF